METRKATSAGGRAVLLPAVTAAVICALALFAALKRSAPVSGGAALMHCGINGEEVWFSSRPVPYTGSVVALGPEDYKPIRRFDLLGFHWRSGEAIGGWTLVMPLIVPPLLAGALAGAVAGALSAAVQHRRRRRVEPFGGEGAR